MADRASSKRKFEVSNAPSNKLSSGMVIPCSRVQLRINITHVFRSYSNSPSRGATRPILNLNFSRNHAIIRL